MICTSLICSANNHAFRIVDYKIHVGFNENNHLLSVDLEMAITELTDNKMELMFTHKADIESISLKGTNYAVPYCFFGKDSIRVTIPENINIRRTQTLIFKYSLPIDSISGSKSCVYCFGRGEKWYPLQYNNLSTHTLTVDLPIRYSSLSTGNLLSTRQNNKKKTCKWIDKYNFTIPLFVFNTDSLQLVSKNAENIKMNFYFHSKDTLVQDNFSNIVSASFQYFYRFFGGDYPYDTYSFIEIPDNPAGSATGSLQVYGTTLISDFYTNGKLYSLKPAAHEVAHEWWGVGRIHFKDKTNDKGLQFLRESVNEYLTFMFIEHYWGVDSLAKCKDMARAYYKEYVNDTNEKPIFEVPQQFSTWEEAVVVYYKGPLIADELRKILGDENWVSFIKTFYALYKDKYATYDDFIQTLSVYDQNGLITKTLNNYLSTKGFKELQ
jgi:aminopeptidase N